jgi:uncharacterized protein (DUF924 family)
VSPKFDAPNALDANPVATRGAIAQVPRKAAEVVAFWREAGPELWFAKDASFDREFRERFAREYERAARGELNEWMCTPEGALALILLLDQYPRNSFRDTPKMYATDEAARTLADAAIAAGFDRLIAPNMQLFIYLPFGHSEDLSHQERSVELARRLGEPTLSHAQHHHDIIKRFGRFPHRNPILGRAMTPEEQAYLDNGGFKG